MQAMAITYLDFVVFGPQVAKWRQQYYELAAPSVLNGGVLSCRAD
jgi:hypothetical protein